MAKLGVDLIYFPGYLDLLHVMKGLQFYPQCNEILHESLIVHIRGLT